MHGHNHYQHNGRWLGHGEYYRPLQPFNLFSSPFHSLHQPYYQQQNFQPMQPPYQPMQPNYFQDGTSGMVNNSFINSPYVAPYPKPTPLLKQQPSGLNTIMSQFKKSDGQLDLNKMIDTAGQMMNAVNQMGGLFKGVTSIFK
ncbi:YppG family protein [Metabacillus niabensis]|uniref:YppG family protein n=1 Tax=Metabacillus niabensis TaxID=324854 RepID=UPI0039A29022